MKTVLRAGFAVFASFCAFSFTNCTVTSKWDTSSVRIYNETSKRVLFQYYENSWLLSDETGGYDVVISFLEPEGEEGAVLEFGHDPKSSRYEGSYSEIRKVLIVDADAHKLLRTLSGDEFYAALSAQSPVVDSDSYEDTEITRYYYDLHLTEAFFNAGQ